MNRYKLTALVDGNPVEYIDKHPDLCKQALERDYPLKGYWGYVTQIVIMDLTPSRKSWLT